MKIHRHTLLVLAALLAPLSIAHAQELAGTYVTYCDTGAGGSLVNGTRSVAYSDVGGGAPCDVFAQGTYFEGFALSATTSSGGALSATVTADTSVTGVTTTSGPTASGRSLAWSGSVSSGTASLRLDQTVTAMASDRAVSVRVVLTNTGSGTLTDLYYARGGDPDQGYCSLSDYTTLNDVVRQPPTDSSALVTATAGGVVVGLGAFDLRARADATSFSLDSPSTHFASPADPAGASGDIVVELVFHVASLAPGASTTLQMYYVFASSSATLLTRFDALRSGTTTCSEGASCSSGGVAGTCHAGACCAGCWNGATCQTGGSASACGLGGGACTSCNDGVACTTDSCSAGACTSTVSSGCMIEGTCVGSGAASPFDACLVCDPSRSVTGWSDRTPCGVDAGPVGEDAGTVGEDADAVGEDAGTVGEDAGTIAREDAGTTTGDGAIGTPDAGFTTGGGGGRRARGCDVGSVGASESGGMLALAMLVLIALVRRREREGAVD